MNFLRKNWLTLLLSVFLVSMFLFPDFRAFVQRQILMKPSLEKVEKDVTFTAEEMNIQLKGVNVPDANLADFKDKVVFLNFWGSWCPPCTEQNIRVYKNYKMPKKIKWLSY